MAAKETTTPDYGLDAPLLVKRMFSSGAWTLAIGVAVFLINRTDNPGPAGTLLAVFLAIGAIFLAIGGYMVWSSRTGKLQLRDQLLDSLALRARRKCWTPGCGSGADDGRRGEAVEDGQSDGRRRVGRGGAIGQFIGRGEGQREAGRAWGIKFGLRPATFGN